MPGPRALRLSAPALLLAAAALLPFLDKAYTVDDPYSLWMAEQILREPLRPGAVEVTWFEESERLTALVVPLGAYLLVPAAWLGAPEWASHLTWLLLLGVAVVATVSLGLRLGLGAPGARGAGLMVAAAPAVLAMASTSMPDVPALALAAAGMDRVYAFRARGRARDGLLAMAALGGAALCRSHAVLLVPVALLALWPAARTPPRAALGRLWPALGAGPLLALALLVLRDPESAGVGEMAARFVVWDERNALSWLGHLALSMPFTLPWLAARFPRLPWWTAAPGALFAAWQLARVGQLAAAAFMVPVVAATVVAGVDALRVALRARDRDGLVLCAWLLLPLPVVAYMHLAPKYLVPCAPAVALLVARALEAAGSRRARAVRLATAASGTALALLIVAADARAAGLGRRAAAELIAPRARGGQRVWFAGHWGFHWYAERAGAFPLSARTRPGPGDAVVGAPHLPGAHFAARLPRKRLVGLLRDAAPGGRVMGAGAGFYSNAWGYLPWAWSRDEGARFELWEVY